MKISDIKTYRKVNRPFKDKNGNTRYKEIEFEIPYDFKLKNDSFRLFAKIIDIIIVILILNILIDFDIIDLNNSIYLFPIILFLVNSILETLIGSSIGKLIFRIVVVDEDCNYLTFRKSFIRNLSCVIMILLLSILRATVGSLLEYYDKKLNEKGIYIISRGKMKEITRILDKKNFA